MHLENRNANESKVASQETQHFPNNCKNIFPENRKMSDARSNIAEFGHFSIIRIVAEANEA